MVRDLGFCGWQRPAGPVSRRKKIASMNEARLFVGNIPYQTLENDLKDYFSQAGAVTSVNLMINKMTGKSRGFAFVEYGTVAEANKAVEQFNSKDFQGRALTVNIARPMEDRPPRPPRPERPAPAGDYRGAREDQRPRY